MEWDRLDAYKEGVCFISFLSLRAQPFMVPLMEYLQVCQLCDATHSLFTWEGHFFVLLYAKNFCRSFVVISLGHVCPYTVPDGAKIKNLVFEHFIVPERCVFRTN